MPGGNFMFNPAWLKKECYSGWLVKDKVKPTSNARCSIYLKTFDVRNMGEAALKSHMNSQKHKQLVPPRKPFIPHKEPIQLVPDTTQRQVVHGIESQPTLVQCPTVPYPISR